MPKSLEKNLVRDHMTTSVISVGEDASLDDVLATLRTRDISSVLVTDATGAARGVVSMTDLHRVSKFEDGHGAGPLRILPPSLKAGDVMRHPVLQIDESATVGEAAATLVMHHVHRIFVKKGETITGVFSTRDAMRVVLYLHDETPIRDVMTKDVVTIELGDTIDEALARLDETNVRGVVVVDGTVPVGVFTQLEAIRARALPAPLRKNSVEEVMSYETICLDVDTPLYRAAGHGIAMQVRRLLVVERRSLAGILSGYDLARTLA